MQLCREDLKISQEGSCASVGPFLILFRLKTGPLSLTRPASFSKLQVRLLLLAALCCEHLLLLGPPGKH